MMHKPLLLAARQLPALLTGCVTSFKRKCYNTMRPRQHGARAGSNGSARPHLNVDRLRLVVVKLIKVTFCIKGLPDNVTFFVRIMCRPRIRHLAIVWLVAAHAERARGRCAAPVVHTYANCAHFAPIQGQPPTLS